MSLNVIFRTLSSGVYSTPRYKSEKVLRFGFGIALQLNILARFQSVPDWLTTCCSSSIR